VEELQQIEDLIWALTGQLSEITGIIKCLGVYNKSIRLEEEEIILRTDLFNLYRLMERTNSK